MPEHKKNKILNKFIMAMIAFFMALVVLFSIWFFYPYKTFVSNVDEFKVLNENKTLKAGDTLVFLSDTCRYRTGQVEIQRTLVNHILVNFTPHTYLQEEVGCVKFENRTVVLPENIPDGEYHLSISVTTQVNPIRDVTVQFRTEGFTVKNPVLNIDPDDIEDIKERLNI